MLISPFVFSKHSKGTQTLHRLYLPNPVDLLEETPVEYEAKQGHPEAEARPRNKPRSISKVGRIRQVGAEISSLTLLCYLRRDKRSRDAWLEAFLPDLEGRHLCPQHCQMLNALAQLGWR